MTDGAHWGQMGVSGADSAPCPGCNLLLVCALIGQVTAFHTGTGTSAFLSQVTIQGRRGVLNPHLTVEWGRGSQLCGRRQQAAEGRLSEWQDLQLQ